MCNSRLRFYTGQASNSWSVFAVALSVVNKLTVVYEAFAGRCLHVVPRCTVGSHLDSVTAASEPSFTMAPRTAVPLREIVYTLSPYNQEIVMQGVAKLPGKIAKFFQNVRTYLITSA